MNDDKTDPIYQHLDSYNVYKDDIIDAWKEVFDGGRNTAASVKPIDVGKKELRNRLIAVEKSNETVNTKEELRALNREMISILQELLERT